MIKKKVAKKAAKKVVKKAAKEKVFGPDIYQRDNHGLLKNVDYIFNEDGSINWRAMIKPDFLYPNRDWFTLRNKPFPDSTEGLKDNQLLIMLGGIKELAKLRGFESVSFKTENIAHGHVKATCRIVWIGNYESVGANTIYEDVANATLDNTDSFASKFLETIACNRAFVRCVRNFLNVHIVGADEIDKSKGADNSVTVESVEAAATTPIALLQKHLRAKKGIDTFEEFLNLLRDFWRDQVISDDDAELVKNWKCWSDIPVKEVRKFVAILHK
jgi:hypothetical protein